MKGLGTGAFVTVVISLLAIFGHKTYKWWRSRQTALEVAATVSEKSTTTSHVTTKTIVASPDDFSDFLTIPPNTRFRWYRPEGSTGCLFVKNGHGEVRKVCLGDHLYLGKDASLLDAMLAFQSLTGNCEEIIVEWEPK